MHDARLKIAALFVYSIALFFADNWIALSVFVASVMVAIVLSIVKKHVETLQFIVPLIPVIILALFAFGFGIGNDPTPEGVSRASMVALRMILLVLASFVVCYTTTSTQLMGAFAWFLNPLQRVGLPVKDICFVLTLALRFIPQIAVEYESVKQAQECRGSSLPGLPLVRRLLNIGALFSAVFIDLFRHADIIATAMDARCYGLPIPEHLSFQRSDDAANDLA